MQGLATAGLIFLLGATLPCPPAAAMQFAQVQISPTEVMIGGRGPIVKGDTARLEQALAQVPANQRLLGLALDSPGGSVSEGEQLSQLIHRRGLTVAIPANSQCASACFLLLAAAPHRLAATDALIGVHSANENGAETETSMAVTTAMARIAAGLGVPSAIIGKMVATAPGRVEWLTPADLRSMQVELYDGDVPGSLHATDLATNRPAPPPSPSAPPAGSAPPSSGYDAGRNDRFAWNAWLGSLRGDYRGGALAALSQHDHGQPEACLGANGGSRGDFTQGCNTAWDRLTQADRKARADGNYHLGWTSEAAVPTPSAQSAEAEFNGVFFCGNQAARMTLQVFAPADGARRRATFSFGPLPTSPTVPRGSFIVEGMIDLHGSTIDMTPVSWVLQPPGYRLLGLNGHSDDGGKTFTGRVTAASGCTVFTLRREH